MHQALYLIVSRLGKTMRARGQDRGQYSVERRQEKDTRQSETRSRQEIESRTRDEKNTEKRGATAPVGQGGEESGACVKEERCCWNALARPPSCFSEQPFDTGNMKCLIADVSGCTDNMLVCPHLPTYATVALARLIPALIWR